MSRQEGSEFNYDKFLFFFKFINRLAEDQMNSRNEFKRMLKGLQRNVQSHEDTVTNVLGKVVQRTLNQNNDNQSVEHILTANRPKIRTKRSTSETDSADNYKVMIVGGAGKSYPISKPMINIQSNENKVETVDMAVGTENESKSIEIPIVIEDIKHEAIIKTKQEATIKYKGKKSLLFGTKEDGIKWITTDESMEIDEVVDQFYSNEINNISTQHDFQSIHDILSDKSTHYIKTNGLIMIKSDKIDDIENENQMLSQQQKSSQYQTYNIGGDRYDRHPIESIPASKDFILNNNIATSIADETPTEFPLSEYHIDHDASSGMNSYWLSRVTPFRKNKIIELPKPIEIKSEVPKEVRLEGDLIALLHSMIKSQEDNMAGNQAMMMTMIDHWKQPELVEKEPVELPMQPTAVEIAFALSDAIKEMITTIQPKEIPYIIQQPVIPNPPIETRIFRDESTAMTESFVSENIQPKQIMITQPFNRDEIKEIVQQGIVSGVKDILEIICPNENDLNISIDSMNDPKQIINKHLNVLDMLERNQHRKTIIEHMKPSSTYLQLPDGLLTVDNRHGIENIIENEINESEKRVYELKRNYNNNDDSDNEDITMLYRDDYDRIDQQKSMKYKNKKNRNNRIIRNYNNIDENEDEIWNDDHEINDIEVKEGFKSRTNHTEGIEDRRFRIKPLISNILENDATKAMDNIDDESLLGSDYYQTSQTNINMMSMSLDPTNNIDEMEIFQRYRNKNKPMIHNNNDNVSIDGNNDSYNGSYSVDSIVSSEFGINPQDLTNNMIDDSDDNNHYRRKSKIAQSMISTDSSSSDDFKNPLTSKLLIRKLPSTKIDESEIEIKSNSVRSSENGSIASSIRPSKIPVRLWRPQSKINVK